MTRPALRRWHVHSTIGVLVLTVVSSLLGLFRPGHYPPDLLPQFYVQDLVILVVAVPVLTIALRYAMAGSFRGRIVWLGALAYTSYMAISIALQVPFNRFFLGYVALFPSRCSRSSAGRWPSTRTRFADRSPSASRSASMGLSCW